MADEYAKRPMKEPIEFGSLQSAKEILVVMKNNGGIERPALPTFHCTCKIITFSVLDNEPGS
jgi:hypothetical protein